MLVKTNRLLPKQIKALEALIQTCQKKDSYHIPLYLHLLKRPRAAASNLLYWQDNHLIAFLGTYYFYEHGCEIALMVSPEHRRQGVARLMLEHALPHLQTANMLSMIFSAIPQEDNRWLKQAGLRYRGSEYGMLRSTQEPVPAQSSNLDIRAANFDDVEALYQLDRICFPESENNMASRFNDLLEDKSYKLYVAAIDGQIIGKAHVHLLRNEIRLADIAIFPAHQKKGYGRELIAHCINEILSTKPLDIVLDVETNNKNALTLYTNLGFDIKNMCDYWEIPTRKLITYLQSKI